MEPGYPVLWHSNAPHLTSHTGYSQQTALWVERFAKEGRKIGVSAFFGSDNLTFKWRGVPIFPKWSSDIDYTGLLAEHAHYFFGGDQRAGMVITYCDPWALDHEVLKHLNVACWMPIDHDPVPPRVMMVLKESGAVPIVWCRWAEQMLWDAGIQDFEYVPLAVDPEVFYPLRTDETKADIRQRLGFPVDAFIVGMVAANLGAPGRKCFPENLEAFKGFLDKRSAKKPAHLYLHTDANGVHRGVYLPYLVEGLGLNGSVGYAPQYGYRLGLPGSDLRNRYVACDVLLATSRAEGFGLPILEAQACGIPVITTNFSSMPELTFAGLCVNGQRMYTDLQSWQVTPDIQQVTNALLMMEESLQGGAESFSKAAVDGTKAYHVQHVHETYWKPTLARLEERFKQATPKEEQHAVTS